MKKEDLKHLGSSTTYIDEYNPNLLERVERQTNRGLYGIDQENLPFTGYDVWNCYEVSVLTENGFPVSSVLKIVYPSDSQWIVESKSLKLFLMSLNMVRLNHTIIDTIRELQERVKSELEKLLEVKVNVHFFHPTSYPILSSTPLFTNYLHLDVDRDLRVEDIIFDQFNENQNLLEAEYTPFETHQYSIKSSLLRSNCPKTNQPDFGDVFIHIESNFILDLKSILKYIVSFRNENHFHEEICECIYKRLFDRFDPKKLMVCCLYTRRGGLDINPIRVNDIKLLNNDLITSYTSCEKTQRQ